LQIKALSMGRTGKRQITLRGRGVAAALVLLGLPLAACSSGPKMPSMSSIFGSNSSAPAGNAAAAYTPPMDFECPGVTVRRGAGTLSVSSNPAEPTALNLRYQISVANTARECRLVGTTLSMKVGVQGRIILGPAGGPSQIDVPLRIAVVHEGVEPKTVVSKLQRIAVNVPPNDSNVLFTHVEEDLIFPMPKGSEIDSYVVYVGFDPLGSTEMDKKKPPPRPTRPRGRS
jgi:hypothetical protein